MARTIESRYDVTEEDVRAVYHTLELTRAVIDYAESKEDHRATFNVDALTAQEQMLNSFWQTTALLVASQRDVTAHDLMEDMANG